MRTIKLWLLFWIVITALNFWCSFTASIDCVIIMNRIGLTLSGMGLGFTIGEYLENR